MMWLQFRDTLGDVQYLAVDSDTVLLSRVLASLGCPSTLIVT